MNVGNPNCNVVQANGAQAGRFRIGRASVTKAAEKRRVGGALGGHARTF